jgi:transcription initiation factor TFIIH subunit 4
MLPMVNLNTVIDYIKQLPKHQKVILYKSPMFTTSIIKIFDDPTIRLIFDLLLTAPSVKSLQKNEELKNSLKILLRIQLISKKGSNIFIDESFRDSFFKGVSMETTSEFFKLKERCDSCNLKNTNFEDILKFLVNKENIGKYFGLVEILMFSNLIDSHQDITNLGFEFLLKPRYDQYWFLIIQALKYFCKDCEIQIENFLSLVETSNMKTGDKYSILKRINQDFYKFLSSLGLLSLQNNELVIFHNAFIKNETEKARFILLETNFKLYAYTTSVYEISIIRLFTDVCMHLPNMIKGNLTEESLSNAFSKGVTSQQIINFLKSYVLFEDIPEAILNQIEIWDVKRKRIRIVPGYLYSNFLNLVDYQKVVKFCVSKDCMIDRDDEKRMIVIKSEFNDILKDYVRKQIN